MSQASSSHEKRRSQRSCGPCRMRKVRCDGSTPCGNCVARDLECSYESRVIRDGTGKLRQKIAQMSNRIQQLEDAIIILQATISTEPHPLLSPELLKIKLVIESNPAFYDDMVTQSKKPEQNEGTTIFGSGTVVVGDDGVTTLYGRTAGCESLLIGNTPRASNQKDNPTSDPNQPQQDDTQRLPHTMFPHRTPHAYLPEDINQSARISLAPLSTSFPIGSSTLQIDHVDMNYLVTNFLPEREAAWGLAQLYLEQAPWYFYAVTKMQLMKDILPMWYHEAQTPDPWAGNDPLLNLREALSTSASNNPLADSTSYGISGAFATSIGHEREKREDMGRTAHDLALIFMIFCLGASADDGSSKSSNNKTSENFYQLTRAALMLEPVLERPPSIATIQVLALMGVYEGIFSEGSSIEKTWSLIGVAAKLAQRMGLHCDAARWKLSPEEVHKRRALFWELFAADCSQSLTMGRPTTFSPSFVNCELPVDSEKSPGDSSSQPGFAFWKARFTSDCLSPVAQAMSASSMPKYTTILGLDRKLRGVSTPELNQLQPTTSFTNMMKNFMPHHYQDSTLLRLHQCFFANAIMTHPYDPFKSQYALSFLTGFRSACEIIGAVKQQFMLFPTKLAKFWFLWTHAFTATVMLASAAIYVSKTSPVVRVALIKLHSAYELFEDAARHGGRAAEFLSAVQRLHTKANKAFEDTQSSTPSARSAPLNADEEENVLLSLCGITRAIGRTSSARGSADQNPDRIRGAYSHQRPILSQLLEKSTGKKTERTTEYQSLVHPRLLHQLHEFDEWVEAQIRQAYMGDQASVGSQQQWSPTKGSPSPISSVGHSPLPSPPPSPPHPPSRSPSFFPTRYMLDEPQPSLATMSSDGIDIFSSFWSLDTPEITASPVSHPLLGPDPLAVPSLGTSEDDDYSFNPLLGTTDEFFMSLNTSPVPTDNAEANWPQSGSLQTAQASSFQNYLIPPVPSPYSLSHPATRLATFERVVDWFWNEGRKENLFWICGLDGVGNSALMQGLASTAAAAGRLAGAAYIRNADESLRLQVFSAISYDLSLKNLSYRAYVEGVMVQNPRLLERASISEQFQLLIVQPFGCGEVELGPAAWLIVIDALPPQAVDEIRLITNFIEHYPTAPLLWAISSKEVEHLPDSSLIHFVKEDIFLDNNQSFRDAEVYLPGQFSIIRRMYHLGSNPPWPSYHQILKVLATASGSLAFVIISARYVGDPWISEPPRQLDQLVLLLDGLRNVTGSPPPSAFDSLCLKVLERIPPVIYETTRRILAVLCVRESLPDAGNRTLPAICDVLNITEDDAYMGLQYLHPILRIPAPEDAASQNLEFHHPDLIEFLRTPTRSRSYCISDVY